MTYTVERGPGCSDDDRAGEQSVNVSKVTLRGGLRVGAEINLLSRDRNGN